MNVAANDRKTRGCLARLGAAVLVAIARVAETPGSAPSLAGSVTIGVVNSGTGADPGYFHLGGPPNIAVNDRVNLAGQLFVRHIRVRSK